MGFHLVEPRGLLRVTLVQKGSWKSGTGMGGRPTFDINISTGMEGRGSRNGKFFMWGLRKHILRIYAYGSLDAPMSTNGLIRLRRTRNNLVTMNAPTRRRGLQTWRWSSFPERISIVRVELFVRTQRPAQEFAMPLLLSPPWFPAHRCPGVARDRCLSVRATTLSWSRSFRNLSVS
jgi:hypothetical protein